MPDPIIQEDAKRIVESLGDVFSVLGGKSILITGANGFLPSYFIDTVLLLNSSVFSDNPATVTALTRIPKEKNSRLLHCIGNPHVKFIIADAAKPLNVSEKFDYIIHAASKASPKEYLAAPIDTIDANVWGMRNILEHARKNPAVSVLFISSGEVYGNPDEKQIPISEKYFGSVNPIGQRSAYQESKRFGETLCYNYWKVYGIPVKIARSFHTYGPRMLLSDGRVIPEFMRRCFSGEVLQVVAGGKSVRTFSYISDTIEAMWRVLLLGRPGEAYNIGSEEEITTKDLVGLLSEIFGNSVKKEMVDKTSVPGAISTPDRTTPDIGKIKRELGFAEKISFKEGLLRVKKWYELYGNI